MTDLEKKERQGEVADACFAVYNAWAFDHTPVEINRGLCEEFAYKVVDQVGRTGGVAKPCEVVVTGCEVDGYDPMGRWGGHVWIYSPASETHHDAEAPCGVENWRDLPFFLRRKNGRPER